MPGHANIETIFVTLQRIVTKQFGSDLFVHFKCVKVVSQTIAYKYGVFPSQPVWQRTEKQNFHLIPSAQSLLTSQFLLPVTWCQAELGDQFNSWKSLNSQTTAEFPLQILFSKTHFRDRFLKFTLSYIVVLYLKEIFFLLKINMFWRSFPSVTFPPLLLLPLSRV